jgi:rfaE bifunctional protein nucleotidyltransferase chain/domain
MHPDQKIKTIQELSAITREAQARGLRVVFANGCFDLLHVGHVRYLSGAKACGDILVVAINSDASVRRLKGAGRPLLAESERAEMVASLEAVDYVTLFDAPTADPLLAEIRPDVHAKGTDYTRDSVPERATVLAGGGTVEIVGDPKDHSTRDLIRSILLRFGT